MQSKIQQQKRQQASKQNIQKKLLCPLHSTRYCYKCDYHQCKTPFICDNIDCIKSHLHDDKLMLTKFNSDQLLTKLQYISDNPITQNAKVLKQFISNLNKQIANMNTQLINIHENKNYLIINLDMPLNTQYLKNITQSYTLTQSIHNNLQHIKQKIKIQPYPIKDTYFYQRHHLKLFLQQNIPKFKWNKCQQIHSSINDLISIKKLHQKLSTKSHLLFIFIGSDKIVGSYYSCPYPTLNQISKKDLNSFLFIISKQSTHIFYPSPQADYHIYISQKNYICHGNKLSSFDGLIICQKYFQSIQYYLPSNSYQQKIKSNHIFNQNFKIHKFLILQINHF